MWFLDVGLTSQSRIEVEAAKVDAYDTLQKHDWIGAGMVHLVLTYFMVNWLSNINVLGH